MINFTQIPNLLLQTQELSDGELVTLLLLLSLKFGESKLFPSQKYIAELRGKDKRTIQIHLKKLKKLDYIDYKKRGYSTSNLYTLNNEKIFANGSDNSEKNFTSITRELSSHTSNIFPPNNINDNNTNLNNTIDEEKERINQKINEIRQKYPFLKSR